MALTKFSKATLQPIVFMPSISLRVWCIRTITCLSNFNIELVS